jgi:DNA-binding response OmpR family regulator
LNPDGLHGIFLQKAIEHAVIAVSESGIEKAVAIVAEYPAHLPPVAGDERTISDVLARTIREVMLQTQREEVRVRAQLLPAAGDLPTDIMEVLNQSGTERGPMALISISDVDAPFMAGEPSSDLDTASPSQFETTLGLEALQEELDPFHGRIWIDAGLQSAHRVWLAIPMRTSESDTGAIGHLKQAVSTRMPEGMQAGQLILFYVEDESMRKLLAQELGAQGYRVVSTGAPEDILPLARANEPDLIILDLQARTPTAIDVATLLKQDRRIGRTPIMFLTTIEEPTGEVRMEVADFLLRHEGTGAIVATIDAVLKSGLHPTARVMVIEPDAALRENIILHIQARGYPVIEASTPEESVALAERVNISLVLVNARLAEERDYWLLRRLRQTTRELAIYVIGKAITDEEGRAAMIRGASGYGETAQLPELLDQVEEKKDDPQA